MKLEERMVSSRTIFEGHIIKVTLDEAELPNGKLAGREVVYHPGGVCVLALDEDGNVPLVRQFRYPIQRLLLELPLEAATVGRRRALPSVLNECHMQSMSMGLYTSSTMSAPFPSATATFIRAFSSVSISTPFQVNRRSLQP